jgi:hypothetical protein
MRASFTYLAMVWTATWVVTCGYDFGAIRDKAIKEGAAGSAVTGADAALDADVKGDADIDGARPPVRECQPETYGCIRNMSRLCGSDGRWKEPIPCAYTCKKDGQCADCMPGDIRCNDVTRERCNQNGQWVPVEVCTKLCVGDKCDDSCVTGTTHCDGKTLYTCTGGDQLSNPQPCDYLCSEENNSAACTGVCVPQTGTCDGNVLLVCDKTGNWSLQTTCQFLCINGVCVECESLKRECVDDHRYRECAADGMWGSPAECTNQACLEGKCQGECSPGQKRCGTANDLQTCLSGGSWSPGDVCAGQTTCINGACQGVCVAGKAECVDTDTYRVCGNEGAWDNPVDCQQKACVDGLCQGDCTPGAIRCAASSSTEYETCDALGQWAITACSRSDELCKDGSCVGVLGYDDMSGSAWKTYDAPANTIIIIPIIPAANVTVQAFQVRGSATNSALVHLALYEDVSGVPGSQVGMSISDSLSMIAGTSSSAVTPSPLAILGGQTYWLAAIFSDSAPIYSSNGSAYPTGYKTTGTFPYLPEIFPIGDATALPNKAYSLSITVRY